MNKAKRIVDELIIPMPNIKYSEAVERVQRILDEPERLCEKILDYDGVLNRDEFHRFINDTNFLLSSVDDKFKLLIGRIERLEK